jgi:CMP-N-acetylneuraminic acid synthetase
MKNKITALIPAREGSIRVQNKNIRILNSHPIVSYSIQTAIDSALFDSIIVASNSNEICAIAKYYGATQVIKRDNSDSSSTSTDIEWLRNLHLTGYLTTDFFAILRPTSPLRSIRLMQDCINNFLNSTADSLRTISKVKEHPGKMWCVKSENVIRPYLPQPQGLPASHAMQYQSLEELYVQTSVFEVAKTSVIKEFDSREGKNILGYVTSGFDSHAIDVEEDFDYLTYLVNKNPELLPVITKLPWSMGHE